MSIRAVQSRPARRWWSAFGVALAAVGCAPPGPRAPESATEALREQTLMPAPMATPLSYLRAGDATGPRVILVHGTPGAATAWTDYLLQPPPGLEIVALDRPGFGRSGPEGAMTSLAQQAAAVVALLPTDGRSVVLLGHSLGGAVAARVAADHPARIAGLVLLAASLDPAQEETLTVQRLGAWGPVRALLPRTLRNANAELMALEPELRLLAADLHRITARTLIVHGTEDDLVPVANVPFMTAHLRGSRCLQTQLLSGANHFLPWNAEPTVRQAINTVLEPRC